MSISDKETEELYEELKWVSLKDDKPDFVEKLKSKGIFGVLVPLGCATTVGVLMSGLYFMIKRDSKKQQVLMRYRVLAQGVTLCLASLGILSFKSS